MTGLSLFPRQEEASRSDSVDGCSPEVEANSRRVVQAIHGVAGERVLKWVTLPSTRSGLLDT
jgi:hypothetical protein